MKNFTRPFFLFIFFIALTLTAVQMSAQTLINTAWVDTLGVPTYFFSNYLPYSDSSTQVLLIANTYITDALSQSDIIMIGNPGGYNIWTNNYTVAGYASNYGTAVYMNSSYVYAAGAALDSSNQHSNFYVCKLKRNDGSVVDDTIYAGSYSGFQVPVGILVDSGSIYVAGTEQVSPTEYEMTVIKYDSNLHQIWIGHYDTANLYTGAVGMIISGGNVVVTGYSGSTFTSFDFLTVGFAIGNGTLQSISRSPSSGGGFSAPAGIVKGNGSFLVTGTAQTATGHSIIKTILYDSLFHEVSLNTYGDSTSANSGANSVQLDNAGGIIITGYTTAANGAKQAVLLRYAGLSDSTLQFARVTPAPNRANDAEGISVASDGNSIYTTAKVSDGTHHCMVTTAFDYSGNSQWQKSFNRQVGTTDDVPIAVIPSGADIIVTGISTGTDTIYTAVDYQQLALSNTAFTDTNGKSLYLKNQIIIKVDSSAVKRSAVDDDKVNFGSLNTYLKQWMVDSITNHLPKGITCGLAKIFMNLKTTDTVSISRLGQHVPIPDFWSTFVLTFDAGHNESAICLGLDQLFPLVQNTELDWVASLESTQPNDHFYSSVDSQPFLHPDPNYPQRNDINVEPAWAYTVGQPYIKVGIVDDGLLLTHQDFIGYSADSAMPSVAKSGYDFLSNDTLPDNEFSDVGEGHGTMVGGVIGAVRNNQNGIAGIAGGEDSISGVSLYGFRIFSGTGDIIASAHALANALVEIASQTPGNTYGWGMHIMNNSYQINITFDPAFQPSLADSGYYIDSNWSTLIDAYHYVNRNQVVQPAAAGNGQNNDEILNMVTPAAFDSIWMFITGGTSLTGEWEGHNFETGTYKDYDQACIGAGMDIAAPYEPSVNYTTVIYPGQAGGSFYWFDGTSQAAAMVSGAVALVCSYLNDSMPSYQNVTPEDAEYIIERSASIIDNTRYDTLTGWGRLNIGAALQMADTAQRKLYHFDSDSVGGTNAVSLAASGTYLYLTERARNNNNTGQVFAPQGYLADIYKITCTVPLHIDSTDTLAAFWERPSSSNTYPYINNDGTLIPHERIFIQSINPTNATITGYIYHLYDTATHASIGWLPMDTTQAETANFAISIMIGDSIRIPIDTITQIPKIKTNYTQLSVFPNPASNNAVVQAASNCQGNVKISVYDMQGIEIQSIFNGDLGGTPQNFPCNTADLAAGMYFVTMQSGCEIESLKFVKF